MEFKNPKEAFDYAMSRSFSICFSPGWSCLASSKDRNTVSVVITNTAGETHWEGKIPVIS